MKKVSLMIDGKPITALTGTRLLWAALENGIYIPHLCGLKDVLIPSASCRLCFVEVEGKREPVSACTEEVFEGMAVRTTSPRVARLRRTAAALLIASHPADCPRCVKNRKCELQKIALHLRLKLRPDGFRSLVHRLPVDDSHPALVFDPAKCLLCGRCVWACREKAGKGILQFTGRGIETRISTFLHRPLAETSCNGCLECARLCPVGALVGKG